MTLVWEEVARGQWAAYGGQIKRLDAKTYCVYRDFKYLGCEASLDEAKKRAELNKRKDPDVREIAREQVGTVVVIREVIKPAPKEGSKRAELSALLQRGCTREEILRVTGWSAVNVSQIAKSLGVGLRTDKTIKPYTYYSEGGSDDVGLCGDGK